MKPLILVSIALLSFAPAAGAQTLRDGAPSNLDMPQAPSNAPESNNPDAILGSPCGPGLTVASLAPTAIKATPAAQDIPAPQAKPGDNPEPATLAAIQCANNPPGHADAPPPAKATDGDIAK